VSSVAATLAFNYFFLEPRLTFTIADPHNWVALFAFLATSIVASRLSTETKRRTQEAVERQRDLERLYTFGRAILLIGAMLKSAEIKSFLDLTREIKLDALVEVHDERELDEALEAGAEIIGVNNRDLKTFDVNLNTSFRLSQKIPDDRIFVVESGIRCKSEMLELIDAGADAFLIGESLIQSSDPEATLRGLL